MKSSPIRNATPIDNQMQLSAIVVFTLLQLITWRIARSFQKCTFYSYRSTHILCRINQNGVKPTAQERPLCVEGKLLDSHATFITAVEGETAALPRFDNTFLPAIRNRQFDSFVSFVVFSGCPRAKAIQRKIDIRYEGASTHLEIAIGADDVEGVAGAKTGDELLGVERPRTIQQLAQPLGLTLGETRSS